MVGLGKSNERAKVLLLSATQCGVLHTTILKRILDQAAHTQTVTFTSWKKKNIDIVDNPSAATHDKRTLCNACFGFLISGGNYQRVKNLVDPRSKLSNHQQLGYAAVAVVSNTPKPKYGLGPVKHEEMWLLLTAFGKPANSSCALLWLTWKATVNDFTTLGTTQLYILVNLMQCAILV